MGINYRFAIQNYLLELFSTRLILKLKLASLELCSKLFIRAS
jgi:hypothetical protein